MLVATSLALMPMAPVYTVHIPAWCHTAIRIVDPDLFSSVVGSKSNAHRPLDRQLVAGRGDCAIAVHRALIWETDASRRSSNPTVAQMNNLRNALTTHYSDS